MTLGSYIKQRRTSLGQSQPELARTIGIEQSYLSKLENDKSIPSNDIFRRLLMALNTTVAELIATLNIDYVTQHLMSIVDIEAFVQQQYASTMISQRRFLYLCGIFIVLAVTMIFTGYSKLWFSEKHYVYQSSGIILPGESNHVFERWMSMVEVNEGESERAIMDKKRAEMAKRSDKHHVVLDKYEGEEFIKTVEGGTRYYVLDTNTDVPRGENAWLQILGVLFLATGLFGLFVERRLYRQV